MKPSKQITVLIADDHALIRQGLRALLARDSGIRVVGEARNGREAIKRANELLPDIILMDISMPIINGLEATRQIVAGKSKSKIVMLSAHVGREYSERAREAGAVGYVAKLTSAEALTSAIHEVAQGCGFLDTGANYSARHVKVENSESNDYGTVKNNSLTSREARVLGLMADGFSKMRIAVKLRVSSASIERHTRSVMAKLGIPSIAGLVAYSAAFDHIENDVVLTIA